MYQHIIARIDAELSRLTAARNILSDVDLNVGDNVLKAKRGRPKKTLAVVANASKSLQTKRVLSPEARAKIAAAQKARWAAAKKS